MYFTLYQWLHIIKSIWIFLQMSILSLHVSQMSMVLPFSVLRMQGHTSLVYVDDSYLQGDSYERCLKNVNDAIIMLWSLGFIIHSEKSVLKPTQNLIYLGFIINSRLLPWQKRKNKIDILSLNPSHWWRSMEY